MITLYGIPNCDTVKKARQWLAQNGVEHSFHDFKKAGLEASRLSTWTQAAGWETLLNKRGTTWRKLSTEEQAAVKDAASAEAAMLANLSLIKRPVVEWENGLTVGFSEPEWEKHI